jgi:hypothetical protein
VLQPRQDSRLTANSSLQNGQRVISFLLALPGFFIELIKLLINKLNMSIK